MRRELQRHDDPCSHDCALGRHLLDFAHRHARRCGVDPDTCEDFAGRVAAKLYGRLRIELHRYREGELSDGWLRACVDNELKDYLRADAVRRRRKTELPQFTDEEGNPIDVEFASIEPPPHVTLIRQELRLWIEAAVDLLETHNGDLFRQHFFEGKTIIELAAAEGKSQDAIRKRLERALNWVSAQLQRWGIGVAEADEYLYELRSVFAIKTGGGVDNCDLLPWQSAVPLSRKKLMQRAKSPVRFCHFDSFMKLEIPVRSASADNLQRTGTEGAS